MAPRATIQKIRVLVGAPIDTNTPLTRPMADVNVLTPRKASIGRRDPRPAISRCLVALSTTPVGVMRRA